MSSERRGADFDSLLSFLKHSRGFDLDGYKRAGLMRRVGKRMREVGTESYEDYLDYLEVHPEEFAQLFDTILINVTAFFRDAPAWEHLSTRIIPEILADKKPADAIRVWCAGVASGPEAYSVAMLLAEALGEQQFLQRVKIYATDVDEDALAQARQASYSEHVVEEVPAELRAKYFEHVGAHYQFRKDLRRAVIFGRHDLLQDAPISRIDLLVCRNTLMYFNAEAQARIVGHFHYALREIGYLLLGKSEMLLTHTDLFVPVDLKRRIFRRATPSNGRELPRRLNVGDEFGATLTNHVRAREAAFDVGPVAQIVIDAGGQLALTNQVARVLFGLTPADLGRPIQDLEVSYRPVELRSLIERASAERRAVVVRGVQRLMGLDDLRDFDVTVTPLPSTTGQSLGTSVTMVDVTSYRRLHEELQRSKQELETAYEELQAANEELETTNEELQSTNEELETTNEELQSSNEELETMNEELQSTNEQLHATNAELRQRTEELDEVNAFLESILINLRVGVVVLDRELRVQSWNHREEDLWGLRADEVSGKHFLGLDIGLPVQQLATPIRSVLADGTDEVEVTVPAMNRRGKAVTVKVRVATLSSTQQRDATGVILLMDDGQGGEETT